MRFSLDARAHSHLAVALVGKHTHGVAYTAPRGAASTSRSSRRSPPKRKLLVYADGELVGEVGDLKDCPMPMQRVGDAERALHGLLVEVRYWATARSKAEINKLRNACCPRTRARTLAGWFTFEEGKGRFVNDVSGQRYRSPISGSHGAKWAEALAATDGDEPPTPASRERSCCKVELRRARLAAKGRENFQLVACAQLRARRR